jgi:glycine/D-amino acid oxidase-like deaminating enzyme
LTDRLVRRHCWIVARGAANRRLDSATRSWDDATDEPGRSRAHVHLAVPMTERLGYRDRSLWLDTLSTPIVPRAQLRRDVAADVVIVGGGFIGLWTAYCLAQAEPTLGIVVLEAEIAGFGAAGRNAGFVSAGIAGQAHAYLARGGWEGVRRAERAMIEGVDWIGEVVAREDIECGWTKGGSLRIATSPAQFERVRAGVESRRQRGLGESDVRLLSAEEVTSHVRVAGVVGGAYTPHCARVHPGRLVRGLAEVCERRGVQIFERSRVMSIDSGRVRCSAGDGRAAAAVSAPVVVQATEAFTVDLPGQHRAYLPVFSHMLASEPLDEATWLQIGWEACEAVADQRHLFTYCQRTIDGRIAIGGRGARYRMGSAIRAGDERSPAVHAGLERTLRAWFPAAASAAITHRWGGVFAVPRDWSMSIEFDRRSGIARAGGLAGHGLVASSLCGRTLADLILERDGELISLPWVGHWTGRWEVEPARVVAQRLITGVLASADRVEDAGRGPARRTCLVRRFTPSR